MSNISSVIRDFPDAIDQLFRKILDRMIGQDPSGLTETFLRILFVARIGVWESALTPLLSYFEETETVPMVGRADPAA